MITPITQSLPTPDKRLPSTAPQAAPIIVYRNPLTAITIQMYQSAKYNRYSTAIPCIVI